MPLSGSTADDRALPGHGQGGSAVVWLQRGWADLWHQPLPSLIYGLAIFVVSWGLSLSLYHFKLGAYLFPAIAGFLIIGPILAMGLYDKSRRIENGEPVDARGMFFVRTNSTTQILFSGVLLCW